MRKEIKLFMIRRLRASVPGRPPASPRLSISTITSRDVSAAQDKYVDVTYFDPPPVLRQLRLIWSDERLHVGLKMTRLQDRLGGSLPPFSEVSEGSGLKYLHYFGHPA